MNDISKEPVADLSEENAEELVPVTIDSADENDLATSDLKVEDAFDILQRDLMVAHDRYARLGAEFENYKKRSEREQQRSIAFANERILVELLPVLDHLDHAVNAAQKGLTEGGEATHFEGVIGGLNLVLKQFNDVMGKFGVVAFSATGQKFDPNLHEAVAQRESAEVEEGTILEEYQKGYTLNDRLVRAARVVVAKIPVEKKSE